jgi:uncharacterized protein YpmS
VRFLLFLFGIAVGVAATLAYAMFAQPAPESVASAPAPQPSAPLTLTLGADFLTALVQRAVIEAPGVSVPRTQVRVELRDDTILVHANVEVLGQPTDGTAVLRPGLRDGKFRVDVVSTHVGAIPLPAFEQLLEKQIDQRVQSLLAGMHVTITGVSIDHAKGLTISCRVDVDKLGPRPQS